MHAPKQRRRVMARCGARAKKRCAEGTEATRLPSSGQWMNHGEKWQPVSMNVSMRILLGFLAWQQGPRLSVGATVVPEAAWCSECGADSLGERRTVPLGGESGGLSGHPGADDRPARGRERPLSPRRCKSTRASSPATRKNTDIRNTWITNRTMSGVSLLCTSLIGQTSAPTAVEDI